MDFTCNLSRDFQFNRALYVRNDSRPDLFGYIVFIHVSSLEYERRRGSQNRFDQISAGCDKQVLEALNHASPLARRLTLLQAANFLEV